MASQCVEVPGKLDSSSHQIKSSVWGILALYCRDDPRCLSMARLTIGSLAHTEPLGKGTFRGSLTCMAAAETSL